MHSIDLFEIDDRRFERDTKRRRVVQVRRRLDLGQEPMGPRLHERRSRRTQRHARNLRTGNRNQCSRCRRSGSRCLAYNNNRHDKYDHYNDKYDHNFGTHDYHDAAHNSGANDSCTDDSSDCNNSS